MKTCTSRQLFDRIIQRDRFKDIPWPVRVAMRNYIFNLHNIEPTHPKTILSEQDEQLIQEHPDYQAYCLGVLEDYASQHGGADRVRSLLSAVWCEEDLYGNRSKYTPDSCWFLHLSDGILQRIKKASEQSIAQFTRP